MIRLAKRHPQWVLGFQDEVWFSRLAQPRCQAWAHENPLRLEAKTRVKGDPDPLALACYGLLRHDTGEMMLRFVAGRPVSKVTMGFLAWVTRRLAQQGKPVLMMVWDNARWHTSQEVRKWVKAHNRRVKAKGVGCRLLLCPLPSKSPWLNNIEPKGRHGKKNALEKQRILSAKETKQRLCRYYKSPLLKPLQQ